MPSLGESTHVFIIRAWIEPREIPGAVPQWRFSIQEIGHAHRTYVQDCPALSEFVQMQLGLCRSSAHWQRRLRRLFARDTEKDNHVVGTGEAP